MWTRGAKEVLRGIQLTCQNEAGKDGVQGCGETGVSSPPTMFWPSCTLAQYPE